MIPAVIHRRFLAAMACATFGTVPAAGRAAGNSEYLVRTWGADQGLLQSSVFGLVQTRDGYLWLATFGGLARFDGITFTTFDSMPGLPSSRILSLCEDGEGILWLATQEAGATAYTKGAFTSYTQRDGLPSNHVYAVVADSAGSAWIGTSDGLVRRHGGHFEAIPFPRATGEEILSLATGVDGRVFAGTNRGIAEFQSARFAVYHDLHQPVLSLYADHSGTVWYGTNNGLYRLDDAHNRVAPVTGEVRAIREDRAGGLWVGSSTGLWRDGAGSWTAIPAPTA